MCQIQTVYCTIFINGKPFRFPRTMSLKDILLYLDFNINLIAVEHNKKILNSLYFDEIFLKHNDSLEIITVAGGG